MALQQVQNGDEQQTITSPRMSRRMLDLSRSMPFSSKDPCGGLETFNFESVKKKLRDQKISHHHYQSQFHQMKLQKIFKTVMKIPKELLTNTNRFNLQKKKRSEPAKKNQSSDNPMIQSLTDRIRVESKDNTLYSITDRFEKNAHKAGYNYMQDINDRQTHINFIDETRARLFPRQTLQNFLPMNKLDPEEVQLIRKIENERYEALLRQKSDESVALANKKLKLNSSTCIGKPTEEPILDRIQIHEISTEDHENNANELMKRFMAHHNQNHHYDSHLEITETHQDTNQMYPISLHNSSMVSTARYAQPKSRGSLTMRERSTHEQHCARNRQNLLSNSHKHSKMKLQRTSAATLGFQDTLTSSRNLLKRNQQLSQTMYQNSTMSTWKFRGTACTDSTVQNLGSLVDRIKYENPDLPEMILDSHQKQAGDVYLKRQAFDPKPEQELFDLQSDNNFIVQYLDLHGQQSSSDEETDPNQKRKQKAVDVFNIGTVMAKDKVKRQLDMQNFGSEQVLKQYRKETDKLNSFMQKLIQNDKPKVWKPNKFEFGGRKSGKTGLASIQDLQ